MSVDSWSRADRRSFSLPRLLPRKLFSLRTLALLVIVALIAGLGWVWYRGSSFVKITHVSVVGLSGPDIPQIRGALTQAALTMTTLSVNMHELEAAVQQYPVVQSISVKTHGDHALAIAVNEQVPVALVESGGQRVPVDGQGQLLSQSTVPHGALPTVSLKTPTSGNEVTSAGALAALQVLQAAPYQLLSHITSATSSSVHGVIVQLENGPQIYFGPTTQLGAKWSAVVAVLQTSGSQGAAYIDVTDPQRPAAGVGVTTTSTTTTSTTASDASSLPST
jgi:cell division septal protein FtsQ